MIRITKMSGKYYGRKLTDDNEEEMDEIRQFASEGIPCIIVEDLDDLENLDIYDEVIMAPNETNEL